jgi:hypothetical protein
LPASPVALLHEWHDFYILIATVSVTIIGAMFVVASIASPHLTLARAAQSRAFFSPIVLHLSTNVLACAVVMVPSLAETGFTVLFGLGSLGGLVYSLLITFRIVHINKDLEDRIWYAVVPVIGYIVMLASVLLVLLREPAALETLAGAMAILLIAGTRNAWDLTLFFVTRERDPN